MPDSDITVTDTQTNVARTSKTDSNGGYTVTELKPGIYSVTVAHEGFKTAVEPAFKLDVNQVVRADVTLSVGSRLEQIVVQAVEPLIESETSSLGQVIEQTRVNDLPLNGRNFIELAYLTPGVNAGPEGIVQQGGIPENERGNGAIQVNGLTATNNNFLLNGFDNNEQQIGFEVIQPSIDAIQEFKVQTNNFGADIGKGGAVVNVVLKSGSNNFHGGLFEFVRNAVFDAKNYFDDPTAPIAPIQTESIRRHFWRADPEGQDLLLRRLPRDTSSAVADRYFIHSSSVGTGWELCRPLRRWLRWHGNLSGSRPAGQCDQSDL